QAVCARGKGLALHLHLVRDRENGVLVRAGAPGAGLAVVEVELRQPIGHQLAPDLSAPVVAFEDDARARVGDRDRDWPDLLRPRGPLVVPARGGGIRLGGGGARGTSA